MFFNWFNGGNNSPPNPQRPQGNPNYPVTEKPVRPTRPPYASGGVFANNPYRPPLQQNPSGIFEILVDKHKQKSFVAFDATI